MGFRVARISIKAFCPGKLRRAHFVPAKLLPAVRDKAFCCLHLSCQQPAGQDVEITPETLRTAMPAKKWQQYYKQRPEQPEQ